MTTTNVRYSKHGTGHFLTVADVIVSTANVLFLCSVMTSVGASRGRISFQLTGEETSRHRTEWI